MKEIKLREGRREEVKCVGLSQETLTCPKVLIMQ